MEKEECLICKAPLVYLQQDEIMECALCHKREPSKTRCVNEHYVCNECHTKGMDSILSLCLQETSKNPVQILQKLMAAPFCHMHGPEHHVMVGFALLTAYHNAGGELDLPEALAEMQSRGRSVPGGACGFWGACGAGISAGMFVSIASRSTPLSTEPFGLSNRMTARALEKNRGDRRPPLLQAGFLPVGPRGGGLRPGEPGGRDGDGRGCLRLFPAEQPVHRPALPVPPIKTGCTLPGTPCFVAAMRKTGRLHSRSSQGKSVMTRPP